jgi:hypothetical protein
MNTEIPTKQEEQEIDLTQIAKRIRRFFDGILMLIFKSILFLKKNILTIGILLILGFILGFVLDKTTKSYNHEIIVAPNFDSNDYLYSKVSLLNSKISEGDTVFLKELGFKDFKKINTIKIEPVVDVYKFVGSSDKKFDMIKLMAEDSDMSKIVNDNMTSKNYTFHELILNTSKKVTTQGFVNPLLKFLNESDYYAKIQKEIINNMVLKMKQNDSIISQIDGFLNNFKKNATNGSKSNNLIYYNENTQLNDIIKTKDAFIKEQGELRIAEVNYDKIVKDISIVTNIRNVKSLNSKLKFVLPILFVFVFLIISVFIRFYKKQHERFNKKEL